MCTHARYTIIRIMRMRTANLRDGPWRQATPSRPVYLSSQASYVIVSGLRAALDLDTYPFSNLIRLRCAERAKPGRGKPELHVIMNISFFACFHAISPEHSGFSEIATFFFMPL